MRFTKREVALAVALLSSGVFAIPVPGKTGVGAVVDATMNYANSQGTPGTSGPVTNTNVPQQLGPGDINPDEVAAMTPHKRKR